MKQQLPRLAALCAVLALSISAGAQSQCNNRDFEDTTFVGWSGATGTNMNGVLLPVTWAPGYISNGNNAVVSDVGARQTIITQNFLDPNVVDPATMLPDTQMTSLAPGGGFASVRIGNSNIGFECEKVSYQFTVTPRNAFFQFQFASVMQDPGHQWFEQPYFMVNFYDQLGNPLICCNDTIWAGDTSVPYIQSGSDPSLLYRRWTPLSKDLSAYLGQTMTVEFVNSDCMYGGHYGYTYVDVSCLGTGVPNVWPGDCDYDLQANNVDFLTLGVAFGATGTVRGAATNSWNAQVSADWSQAVPLGANYKHSDCNGDGTVDLNDTLAITLNYGQGHAFRQANPGNEVGIQSTAMIYLVPVNDTVGPMNYAYVDIYAGTTGQPLNDFYGTAFTLTYDNMLVQPNTVTTDFSGSWMGVKNSSMITLGHDNYSAGENDIAITRITQTEVNGYGYIGTMRLSTANVTTMQTLDIGVGNIMTVNGNSTVIPMSATGCQIVIDPTLPVNVNNASQEMHVSMYPNPATESVAVSANTADKIEITNALGQIVFTTIATGNVTTVDVSAFEAGVYFVNVYSAEGKTTRQLIVQ